MVSSATTLRVSSRSFCRLSWTCRACRASVWRRNEAFDKGFTACRFFFLLSPKLHILKMKHIIYIIWWVSLVFLIGYSTKNTITLSYIGLRASMSFRNSHCVDLRRSRPTERRAVLKVEKVVFIVRHSGLHLSSKFVEYIKLVSSNPTNYDHVIYLSSQFKEEYE